jgi:DNA polymerase III subunit delta'
VSLWPWLETAAAQLRGAHAAGRLPPALLIHEAPGTGAGALARLFAQLRFCTAPQAPCGQCTHCRRVAQGEHPDFVTVGPDEKSKLGQIVVEQVRELAQQLSLSSYEGRGTVLVIQPAEALNRNAANALLKTLEEPRPDAHLILITSAPSLLPATIRSRCQKLAVQAPDRAMALAWLGEQQPQRRADWPAVLDVLGVAPLEAATADVDRLLTIRADIDRLLEDAARGRLDVVRVAQGWAGEDLPLRLAGLENCLTQRLLTMRADSRLPGAVPDINMASSLRLLTEVGELRRQLAGAALNKPLAVERVLWRLQRG